MKNEFVIIAYLLKNRRALKKTKERIKPYFFTDHALKTFYGVMLRSLATKDIIVTYNVLDQMLRKRAHKTELYDAYNELLKYQNTTGDEFLYALKHLVNNYKKKAMITGVTSLGQELMGDNVDKAHEQLNQLLKQIDSAKTESEGVTVHLRDEAEVSLEEYNKVEEALKSGSNEAGRCLTGINYIDAITGGGKRGELWVWGAYTSEGKTALSMEITYRTCTEYKSNVLFISLEMTIEEIKRIIEARHSHRFHPGGLLTKKIELGTLDKTEKEVYQKTLADWKSNPAYGKIALWSPPYNCTVDHIASKIEEVSYEMNIDLVVIDYAELVSLNKFMEKRLQVTEVMKQLKDLARTFNNNKGVWIFTPHQMSRGGKDKADHRGYYTRSDFAESAGVERTANLCGWNLVTDDLQAEGKVRIGICKYRTGQTDPRGKELMADWAHSLITEVEEVTSFDENQI
jgi:replicative DNA helicase